MSSSPDGFMPSDSRHSSTAKDSDTYQHHATSEDTHCKYCKTESNGRNLVVAIDGTSNQFGLKYSNVVDIYRRIDKEIVLQGSESKQLTYYNSGVGTYANPSHKWTLHMAKTAVESTVDMAIALNFERTILAAYRWLSEKYVRGDRIFLFGFSRGAYQVRVLAGMIKRVGLLKGGNEEQIPFAYELYESGDDSMCSEFRKAFSAEAPIHFLGVWDSVSSVGLTRGKGLPLARSWGHICYVRHALALDERRVKFVPEEYYVQHRHGHGVPSDVGPSAEHYVSEMEHTEDDVWKSNTEVSDRLKEVWFVGCHADVGGTTTRKPDKHLIDEFPAMWMANEARFAGLQFKAAHPHWDFHLVKSLKFNESLRSFWRVLEVIPFLGREEDHPNRYRWILPHWGSHRYIKPHQKIHVSVAFVPDYHPKARFWPHSGHSWDNILDHSTLDHIERLRDPIIELDLYDHSAAPHLVDRLRQYLRHEKADSPLTPGPPRHEADVDDALARLTILAISDSGARAILSAAGTPDDAYANTSPDEKKTLWECLRLVISSASTGPTIRIRALKFIDRMTNHREAREVLRQMRDFLPWLVQQRQYMGIVPKEPWDPKHLQAGPLPLAITKTILNLLRSSSQEEIPSTRCEGFKHDIDDLRQLGIGSEQNIQALVLDALDTDNAAEAISALPLVLNNAANISDKLVAVFKSPKVLHHIKVSASIRLCSPHWGSIDDDKSNTLHMSINESVVGSILGLLELSYSDAVIPALFDVSAFYFRRSRKSHNNELERLRRGTRTATADMPLLEKGTAKMANQDIDYICGLIRRAMRELALPPSGDDELPAETPTETTAESDFEDLTLKLQSADATFITKSMDTVDLEKFEPSIKRYWGYVASALGSDTELLSRFVELLKDDKLHKAGRHRESFDTWLKAAIKSGLILAQVQVIRALSKLDIEGLFRHIILDKDEVASGIKAALCSEQDEPILIALDALFNLVHSSGANPVDDRTLEWFQENRLLNLSLDLLQNDNVHIQLSATRLLSRFIRHHDIKVQKTRRWLWIRHNSVPLKKALGPYVLHLLLKGRLEDDQDLAAELVPLLSRDDRSFRLLMKKRNVVRRLFDLEKTECMKELQKYDQGIGMKKQLTAAAKELSEDLQDTLLGKRRLAQRLLRCWATFDLFKQCVKETNLISELEKALHSRKDDEVKRSVLDSLMYLLSNEGYATDVRQAILSKDVNGVLPLQLLLDSSDDQTAHSAMAAMEGLLKYDRPERPDSGRTHSSGLLQSSANAQLFIRMLVTLRRSIKASQYVRDAAFHTLHRLYDEQPDVKAILSAHGHADIRRQFKRIGKRHEGEDPEKQEALVSHG